MVVGRAVAAAVFVDWVVTATGAVVSGAAARALLTALALPAVGAEC